MGRHGDLMGLGLVGGAGLMTVAGLVSYTTVDEFGLPSWTGPVGLAGAVGLTAAAVMGSRTASRSATAKHAAHRQAIQAAAWNTEMTRFAPRVHPALAQLVDPWQSCMLWTHPKMGMGRPPNRAIGDPGAWPTVLPWDAPPPGIIPDPGFWPLPVGARVRLLLPEGLSARDLAARLDNLASALNVPKVRITGADGNQVTIDLRVFDPLGEVIMSPLIQQATADDGRMIWCSTVPLDSLSCMDDINLGINEFGDTMPINFARGVHRALQGATRSGKSVSLYSMILASLLMRDTVTVIIDPNGATVAPFWQCADYVCDSQDPKEATALLDLVINKMYERKELFAKLRTDRITQFSPEMPLWNVFIDENSNYEGDKKYAAKLKIAAKQLAKFGGRITLADQKLSAEALSTAVRINLFDRISHRVESRHDFDHLFPGLPDMAEEAANPHNPMPQGVAIARLMDRPEPSRMRVFYLPSEACYDIGDQITAVRGPKRPPMGVDQDLPADTEQDIDSVVELEKFRQDEPADDGVVRCKYSECGIEVEQTPGKRRKEYCSPAHRTYHYREQKRAQGQ